MCVHSSRSLTDTNALDQEYISRPTAPAAFWDPPFEHVLGGRDLLREIKGTWLGLTRDGRVAVLTNFREADAGAAQGVLSRGAMVNAYLTPRADDVPNTSDFAQKLINGRGARGAGGFSLVCGKIGSDLAVVSNRMSSDDDIRWIKARGDTIALSNAAYGDHSWPKVELGEQKLRELIRKDSEQELDKAHFIKEAFKVLENDTMPRLQAGATLQEHADNLRKTIFIPPIGRQVRPDTTVVDGAAPIQANDGVYATQKQTVILVEHSGLVTFIEKSLFHGTEQLVNPEVRKFEVQLAKDWQQQENSNEK